MRRLRPILVCLAIAVTGCESRRSDDWAVVSEITPAFLGGVAVRDPAIATGPGGRIALTWVTRDSTGRDAWISVSRDSGATFSSPARVNLASGRVVSFPEGRPLPVFGPRGALALIWSERRADTSGAVDVRVRSSADGGLTLGPVATVNDDANGPPPGLGWTAERRWRLENKASAFHGFPTLAYLGDGSLYAAWLDERHVPDTNGEPLVSALYHSLSFDGGQTWTPNAAVSDSACPCCRPMAVAAGDRIALAYRSAYLNLRDPALALLADGGRTFVSDTVLHHDRWYLEACPDQGTVVAWSPGGGGHYAWYTGADPGGIFIVPWRDDGGAAGLRRAVDDGTRDARNPRLVAIGDVALLGVEASPAADTTRHVLAVRALRRDGSLTPWMNLGARASSGWLTAAGERTALACWIESDAGNERMRVARLLLRHE